MIDRLGWLHISDLHFVAGGKDEFSQQVASQALLNDARVRQEADDTLSFVLVTGDVAFSGQAAEYERATVFLSEFANAVGIPPARFFFVPGNHDVDRVKSRLAYMGACSSLTSQPEVDRLLGSPRDVGPLLDRQLAFREFVDAFTGDQARLLTDEGLAFVAPIEIGGLRVTLLGLNSAWLSGDDAEEMRLVIGERQVINALQIAAESNPHLQIAMAHHPIEWLQEWDQLICRARLLPEVHFFHRGHLHIDEVAWSSSPERPCLSVAAGSGHATRFYENSYNRILLDIAAGECLVEPFRYDVKGGLYAPGPQVRAPMVLQGSLPGTRVDLIGGLEASVPGSKRFSEFLAGLIFGDKAEIPIRVGGEVIFRTASFAGAAGADGVEEAIRFMNLRNLLRLYDESVPLAARVAENASLVADFVEYLNAIAAVDSKCADRLSGHRTEESTVLSGAAPRSYAADFLADLRSRADWPALEAQSRRLVDSQDKTLAREARRALSEALMHSDQGEKRKEAVSITQSLINDDEASAADHALAAGCLELVGDDSGAITIATLAIERWPKDMAARDFARALAYRTGNSGLRLLVERAAEGAP